MPSEWTLRLATACLGALPGMLIAWAAGCLLPRLPATVRGWLWWLACLKLVVGLVCLPALSLPVLPDVAFVRQIAGLKHPEGRAVDASLRAPTAASSASADRARLTDDDPSDAATAAAVPTSSIVPSSSETSAPSFSPQRDESVWAAVLGVWLVGIGVALGMQGNAMMQMRRLARAAVPMESAALTEAARRMGLKRVPTLRVALSPTEPLTLEGARQPTILISQDDLSRLTPDELLTLLTHECAHVKRGDLYLALLPCLAQTLFWFFPPAHGATREFGLACEAACDQRTIAVLALAPHRYGELLVKMSSPASPWIRPSSVVALSAGFHQLKRRIEMIGVPSSARPVSQPTRALLTCLVVLAVGVLAPWRLAVRATAHDVSHAVVARDLPNLDLRQGLTHWRKTAMGSDIVPHPFYEIGVSSDVRYQNRPSGYVRARQTGRVDSPGDGGVLRYDVLGGEAARYRGKRVRLSAFVRGVHLNGKAFLFLGAIVGDKLYFGSSPDAKESWNSWRRVACVVDVPQSAEFLMLGLRLEGKGIAYGSEFHLEVVDKSVPLSESIVTNLQPSQESPGTDLHNLGFEQGLGDWWNDNPRHTATDDYALAFEPQGGRDKGPAIRLSSRVPHPRLYGTMAQNALPGEYRGKRVRFSAYLKSEDADKADLWLIVFDRSKEGASCFNGDINGTPLYGTKGWTKIEYTADVPDTATGLSFGASLQGKGKVWVDGFHFEAIGPAQPAGNTQTKKGQE